jgi:hypothetical protein
MHEICPCLVIFEVLGWILGVGVAGFVVFYPCHVATRTYTSFLCPLCAAILVTGFFVLVVSAITLRTTEPDRLKLLFCPRENLPALSVPDAENKSLTI